MEETLRRTTTGRNTATGRSTVSYRRKNKPQYNYRIFRKIIIQLIISSFILICILSFKNIDTPFTKQISTRLDGFASSSYNFRQIYKNASDFVIKAGSMLKGVFYPLSKTQTDSTQGGAQKDIPKEQQNQGEIGKTNKESATDDKSQIAVPTASSINLFDIYARSIKTDYKIALPLNNIVTSKFGLRTNPITKKEEFHPGIDIRGSTGTPIYSAISGEVIESKNSTSYGNFVRIQSGKDIITLYAHCSKLIVKKGQKVSLGQKIAEVGNTGMSNGPHLHFEVWKDGNPVDPSYLYTKYASK